MVNIKVAVRIRPFSQREVNQKDESIVETYEKSVHVTNLKVPETTNGDSRQRVRKFAVDFCYDPKQPETCTQESVYEDVGKEVLNSMFNGYNACVLAYGHSASGKTYTMMGNEDEPGLTPRICQGLFRMMEAKAANQRARFLTVVSFLEIYNERVRDLLVSGDSGATAGSNFSLRVREHPKLGPYVQDLSQHIVSDEERILEYLAVGNSRRSTAATENNTHSSRSHAVFTIRFKHSDETNFESELSSKVHLVDLAGSERAGTTQSRTRLKEGANINKSLVTLGNVISALAESCETFVNLRDQPLTKTWQPFVPYRDSVLTWLLKDTLGGNSNTIMIATVSPASSCLNETINTLRYAKRTKRIVNQPIINEDPKVRTIRELREEIEKLKNIILTLQINKRITQNDNVLSPQCPEEKNASVSIAEEEFQERLKRVSNSLCEGDNGSEIIGDVESDAICGLDILPDLTTAKVGNNVESHDWSHQIGITAPSVNSISVDVSKINDEKKTDVNGAVIDKLAHESQVFSDGLESFPTVSAKQRNRSDIFNIECAVQDNTIGKGKESRSRKRRLNHSRHIDNQSLPKILRTSKLRICSRRHANGRLKLYLRREFNSLENLSLPKMLHRSRPDLIKGIASHSKDGLPSTSSQSFTDVSGLSQSTSENSLNSTGSVESQVQEIKAVKCWPEKTKIEETARTEEAMQKSSSRQSSIGDGSGSSTPTQIPKPLVKRRVDKRSEIVAAVTTRLYATKKKPDARMEALQAAEKDDDDDGELEELKLCKRARMKLFDLSRKLAMAKRIKKTSDSDTQTDFGSGTIRVKEKSVVTDQSGIVQYESSATNTPSGPLKKNKEQPIIMNQVFIPRFSNYVVECGKNVRVAMPAAKPATYELGTQTVTICRDQSTSPSRDNLHEQNFSDDSLEDEELENWKKDCELDSLEMFVKPETCKPSVKCKSNENMSKGLNMEEQISFAYRRSYDSLIDCRTDRIIDRSWLPVTRFPIAGTNALYEYDPNKSAPDLIYSNMGCTRKTSNDAAHETKCANDEPSGNKIRRTEIILPMFNGLPLAICRATSSSSENIAEDAVNFINRCLPGREENASSENSFDSNEGSDVTSSSETSSEDFIFYEAPRQKEGINRQSGLGNLYTISENSELSDMTTSDPSSPQPSQRSPLLVAEQNYKSFHPLLEKKQSDNRTGNKFSTANDYAVDVHILRNPVVAETMSQDKTNKASARLQECNCDSLPAKNLSYKDRFGTHPEFFKSNEKCANSGSDSENSFYTTQQDIPTNKFGASSSMEAERRNSGGIKPSFANKSENSELHSSETFLNGEESHNKESERKAPQKHQKKGQENDKIRKINWGDVQSPWQRQFLNFNILGPSRQTPFSIDSNMFGEKRQASEGKFPSEDSITFVFMGPNRQKTSMLMEIIKRTLGQGSSSDTSVGEKSHKKSRNRGIQCKLMRSVSVDTAMIALSRFAKHQRPGLDITRTSSLDTLVPEEMQTILEQGRLHGIRESSCQCDLRQVQECLCRKAKPHVIKYTICTSTTRDQSTETEKCLEMADKSSMTSSLGDTSSDVLNELEENLFDEYFPALPRTKLSSNDCQSPESHWKDMKDVILGTSGDPNHDDDAAEKPKRVRKTKKSVSWSDLSECEDLAGGKRESKVAFAFERTDFDRPTDTVDNYLIKQDSELDYAVNTRRVRFTEPQSSSADNKCQTLQEKEDVHTAANMTAFLKEAVQLLKNLNNLSQIYDLGDVIKRGSVETDKTGDQEVWQTKSYLKRVERAVQTDGSGMVCKSKEISLSTESSPIRRVLTSNALSDKKAPLNLTWPRQRSTTNCTAIGKPPTGLKYSSVIKSTRSPLSSHALSTHSSYDGLKNDIETSSTSTNWNISNLSTTFSNSCFGDSGCSRPSSSKSFYSDGAKVEKHCNGPCKYWGRLNSKILSPRLQKENLALEIDLQDSCQRLQVAVENDRRREESSAIKLSSLNSGKYVSDSWYYDYDIRDRFSDLDAQVNVDRIKKPSDSSFRRMGTYQAEKSSILPNGKTPDMKVSCTRTRPCKCYCHYRNTNKVYRSTLELEAQPSLERHCHSCCAPCETVEPVRSNSTPALNSICDSEKCRLFYYGYCPCSSVKLQHVKSSPRAYMQHLLSLRRKIVKTTYDSANNV